MPFVASERVGESLAARPDDNASHWPDDGVVARDESLTGSLPALGPIQSITGVVAKVGMKESRVGRQLQMKAGCGVDASSPCSRTRSRTWPPAFRSSRQEMQVEPWHIQAAGKVREAEARQRSAHVFKMKHRLRLGHLGERWIGLFLPGTLRAFTDANWPSTRTA